MSFLCLQAVILLIPYSIDVNNPRKSPNSVLTSGQLPNSPPHQNCKGFGTGRVCKSTAQHQFAKLKILLSSSESRALVSLPLSVTCYTCREPASTCTVVVPSLIQPSMGQYWILCNLDKKEILEPWDLGCGDKLYAMMGAYSPISSLIISFVCQALARANCDCFPEDPENIAEVLP